jgi:hypothetical protein
VSNGAIPEHEIGSIAILIGLSCAINLMIKIALRPVAHRRLDRVAASFRARCRAVVRAAIALFDATDPLDQERCRQRLHLALASANESAIILDGTLTGQNATPAFAAADDAHHELIELELLVQEVGRTAETLASAPLPASVRAEMQGWLAKLSFDDVDASCAQGVNPPAIKISTACSTRTRRRTSTGSRGRSQRPLPQPTPGPDTTVATAPAGLVGLMKATSARR